MTKDADGSYQAYGGIVINLPTTDTDGDGLPDIAQLDKAGTTGLTGTAMQDWPMVATVPLSGSLTRAAGAATGTYQIVDVATGGSQVNFPGVWELVRYSGSVNYVRGTPNTIAISISRTSSSGVVVSLAGATTFTVASANQLSLPLFTVANTSDNSVYTVSAATFNRNGNRYVGVLTLADGDKSTAWPDYVNWVFEITDLNDTDSNSIPNLTDTPPTPPTILASPGGNNFTLQWPATAGRYRLESAVSFSPVVFWSNVTGSFQTNSGVISVVQPMSGAARKYYRLVEP